MCGKTSLLLVLCGISTILADGSFYYKEYSLYRDTGEKFVDFHFPSLQNSDNLKGCKTSVDDIECVQWGDSEDMNVTNIFRVSSSDTSCVIMHVDMEQDEESIICWEMSDLHWYGGGEEKHQNWPLEGRNISKPMVPVELQDRAIVDSIWYNSAGDLIFVGKGAPIFLEMNTTYEGELCIRGNLSEPYRMRDRLEYDIHYCSLANVKEAFQYLVGNFISKPSGLPDERMIRYPIWSTWAQYSRNINDTVVREFANAIISNGFNNSQLEIDDMWETCYGSTTFDTDKFPDIKNLTDYLHDLGFRVTLWSHFFIELTCDALDEPENDGYMVANMEGNITTKWWNGIAAVVDFTKTDAKEWWLAKHNKMMKKAGIDGIKCDAGEISWLPQLPNLNITKSNTEDYPAEFTANYLKACATFGGITEFRSAHYTQELPIFLRMLDKDSVWGYNNGLKTLITTLLNMNAVGYSLVLPDMIGGNAYDGDVVSDQLFIRWVQANTFMPAMQFSVLPWGFENTEVNTLALKFSALHDKYTDTIIAAMNKSVVDGTPVNPPIWWISPEDEVAQVIDSEYLLGESILVAPVLEDNVVERDIYLPNGTWVDGNNGSVYQGPQWLKSYSAPLDTLPYFILKTDQANAAPGLISWSFLIIISVFIGIS